MQLHSRESIDGTLRPQLALTFKNGQRRYIEAAADASLDCSTYTGLGEVNPLLLKVGTPLALRFELPDDKGLGEPVAATLILVREPGQSSAATMVVTRLVSPVGKKDAPPAEGIAAKFPMDARIQDDQDVVFVDGFNDGKPSSRWTTGMRAPYEVVAQDPLNGFRALDGPALRVKIPKGGLVGLDFRYRFKQHLGHEPDRVYLRYYIRFASDWLNAAQGGKLPGLAGTYGAAGWGGRPWDGQKGWSMRGAYYFPATAGHPAHGQLMLGSYAYHADSDKQGENMAWFGSGLSGLVHPNRWTCIEQYVQLNTPGRRDGEFKVWVDGRLTLRRTGLSYRDLPDIHIEEAWMNFYHGGMAPAPTDMHAYIDNVVIARQYIGPMHR